MHDPIPFLFLTRCFIRDQFGYDGREEAKKPFILPNSRHLERVCLAQSAIIGMMSADGGRPIGTYQRNLCLLKLRYDIRADRKLCTIQSMIFHFTAARRGSRRYVKMLGMPMIYYDLSLRGF